MIKYDSVRTPIGVVFVAVSDRGVCDVTFGKTSQAAYRRHLSRWASEVERDHSAVAAVLEELDAYFTGLRRGFSVPVDLRDVSDFTARVLHETRRIRFGELRSYGDVARRIGSPMASRAVGGALGRNPVPVIVPCHRVIAQGGRLGGFTGGLATKRALLRIEGHPVEGNIVRQRCWPTRQRKGSPTWGLTGPERPDPPGYSGVMIIPGRGAVCTPVSDPGAACPVVTVPGWPNTETGAGGV